MHLSKRPSYEDLLRALTALHYLANGTSLAWHPCNVDARVLIAQAG
jgi:hypothetical protein